MTKSPLLKTALIWLAGVRVVLGIAAILSAKWLYKEHFIWLVVMRPTKEVMLAGAFLARRRGDPTLLFQIALATIPLSILGVWHFYYLGRLNSKELTEGSLPEPARRMFPTDKFNRLQRVLKKKGQKVVFLGRLAAFPSSMLAAAAGSSEVRLRPFVRADLLGAAAALVEVMGIGYLLGHIFKPDRPETSWILTGVGVSALFVLLNMIGRQLTKD
ncbi:MAG: VTT domain-containing protein [Actinomycetota bacterium]